MNDVSAVAAPALNVAPELARIRAEGERILKQRSLHHMESARLSRIIATIDVDIRAAAKLETDLDEAEKTHAALLAEHLVGETSHEVVAASNAKLAELKDELAAVRAIADQGNAARPIIVEKMNKENRQISAADQNLRELQSAYLLWRGKSAEKSYEQKIHQAFASLYTLSVAAAVMAKELYPASPGPMTLRRTVPLSYGVVFVSDGDPGFRSALSTPEMFEAVERLLEKELRDLRIGFDE